MENFLGSRSAVVRRLRKSAWAGSPDGAADDPRESIRLRDLSVIIVGDIDADYEAITAIASTRYLGHGGRVAILATTRAPAGACLDDTGFVWVPPPVGACTERAASGKLQQLQRELGVERRRHWWVAGPYVAQLLPGEDYFLCFSARDAKSAEGVRVVSNDSASVSWQLSGRVILVDDFLKRASYSTSSVASFTGSANLLPVELRDFYADASLDVRYTHARGGDGQAEIVNADQLRVGDEATMGFARPGGSSFAFWHAAIFVSMFCYYIGDALPGGGNTQTPPWWQLFENVTTLLWACAFFRDVLGNSLWVNLGFRMLTSHEHSFVGGLRPRLRDMLIVGSLMCLRFVAVEDVFPDDSRGSSASTDRKTKRYPRDWILRAVVMVPARTAFLYSDLRELAKRGSSGAGGTGSEGSLGRSTTASSSPRANGKDGMSSTMLSSLQRANLKWAGVVLIGTVVVWTMNYVFVLTYLGIHSGGLIPTRVATLILPVGTAALETGTVLILQHGYREYIYLERTRKVYGVQRDVLLMCLCLTHGFAEASRLCSLILAAVSGQPLSEIVPTLLVVLALNLSNRCHWLRIGAIRVAQLFGMRKSLIELLHPSQINILHDEVKFLCGYSRFVVPLALLLARCSSKLVLAPTERGGKVAHVFFNDTALWTLLLLLLTELVEDLIMYLEILPHPPVPETLQGAVADFGLVDPWQLQIVSPPLESSVGGAPPVANGTSPATPAEQEEEEDGSFVRRYPSHTRAQTTTRALAFQCTRIANFWPQGFASGAAIIFPQAFLDLSLGSAAVAGICETQGQDAGAILKGALFQERPLECEH